MQDLFSELKWRGQVNQTTDDENLPKFLMEGPKTVYAGFDPTADSLHIGHLIALTFLRRFQRVGHKPLALVGGATGMIGDPSGKSAERNLLSPEQIEHNVECIKKQMTRFLDFDSPSNKAQIVNNFDWMGKFTYLEFLRDVGKMFSVNVMLGKDSVKKRIESDSGISYTEFSYMLIQSYDFVHLYDAYGCQLQIGGSDQWGNISTGCELGRRMRGAQFYGLTCPLLTKSDGTKMGKSEGGALWLDANRTSPYQFYQYWINIEDADVPKVLKLFSDDSESEINALIDAHMADPGKRLGQKEAARVITKLVHGDAGLSQALAATDIFFGAEIEHLSDSDLTAIFADVPGAEITADELSAGIGILDAFVKCSLAKSKGEARRTIEQGGAYVNNRRVTDPQMVLNDSNLASETTIVLRSGKKKYALLRKPSVCCQCNSLAQLNENQFERISSVFPKPRANVKYDNRTVFNALIYLVTNNATWRSLPKEIGPWRTLQTRFNRWVESGIINKAVDRLREEFNMNLDVSTLLPNAEDKSKN